jgi:hypothetical protein
VYRCICIILNFPRRDSSSTISNQSIAAVQASFLSREGNFPFAEVFQSGIFFIKEWFFKFYFKTEPSKV